MFACYNDTFYLQHDDINIFICLFGFAVKFPFHHASLLGACRELPRGKLDLGAKLQKPEAIRYALFGI